MDETNNPASKPMKKTSPKSSVKSGKTTKASTPGKEKRDTMTMEQEVQNPKTEAVEILSGNSELEKTKENIEINKETEKTKDDVGNETKDTNKKRAGKRKLCKLVKKDYLKKHFEEYEELVSNPMYICGKCGRASKDKKSLCKPVGISKLK